MGKDVSVWTDMLESMDCVKSQEIMEVVMEPITVPLTLKELMEFVDVWLATA